MNKEEPAKVIKKIEIVLDWYDEMTGGEYTATIRNAQDLIDKLDIE